MKTKEGNRIDGSELALKRESTRGLATRMAQCRASQEMMQAGNKYHGRIVLNSIKAL